MLVLGIHVDAHDTGAVLIRDKTILAAINEERLSRIKEDSSPPMRSVEEVLKIAKVMPVEIDRIVISGFKKKARGFYKEHLIFYYKFPSLFFARKGLKWKIYLLRRIASSIKNQWIRAKKVEGSVQEIVQSLRKRECTGKVQYSKHHINHLASAYYTSGWNECLVVNVEGSSYDYSTNIAIGREGKLKLIASTPYPHSAGNFYDLVTKLLGFRARRHAGKITGLAAFGNPEVCHKEVSELLWCEGLELRNSAKLYHMWMNYNYDKTLPPLFINNTRENLAAAFQRVLEESVVEMVKNAVEKTGLKRIALAGGVCGNVKMNQRILEIPGVKAVFVFPGMGDVGQAMGAALEVLAEEQQPYLPFTLKDVYLGREYTEAEIKEVLDKYKVKYKYDKEIEKTIAKLIVKKKVIARFNGRMEFGPRALGNRTIIYSPEKKEVNDWLNKRLKRTEFMPFAPATLIEFAEKSYKNIKGGMYPAKFMTITFDCTDWMKKTCRAVVHVDGTARPQLVEKTINPSFYKIIEEYYRLTKLPSVVNTSFNMHEEPIVCSPEDAVRSFLEGNLDYLAIGNFLVEPRKLKESIDKRA